MQAGPVTFGGGGRRLMLAAASQSRLSALAAAGSRCRCSAVLTTGAEIITACANFPHGPEFSVGMSGGSGKVRLPADWGLESIWSAVGAS